MQYVFSYRTQLTSPSRPSAGNATGFGRAAAHVCAQGTAAFTGNDCPSSPITRVNPGHETLPTSTAKHSLRHLMRIILNYWQVLQFAAERLTMTKWSYQERVVEAWEIPIFCSTIPSTSTSILVIHSLYHYRRTSRVPALCIPILVFKQKAQVGLGKKILKPLIPKLSHRLSALWLDTI